MARGMIQSSRLQRAAGTGARVEIFGGLSMECAVQLYSRLKEVRCGVFPDTEDEVDE
jgi:hypothetical protein